MSEEGKVREPKVRKHRHEGPDVAHGAHSQEGPVVALQFILGATIVLSIALLIYALLSSNVERPIT